MDYIAGTGFSVGQKRVKEGEILKNVEPGLGHMLESSGVAKPYTATEEKHAAVGVAKAVRTSSGRKKKEPETANIADAAISEDAAEISQE